MATLAEPPSWLDRNRLVTALGLAWARAVDGFLQGKAVFKDAATIPQRTRQLEYEKQMAALSAKFGEDPEARIFYALALDQTALPTDKTYAKQLQAAEILEAEVVRQPDHPGVVHYLIHTYDYPPLAERGLAAAERYAELAADPGEVAAGLARGAARASALAEVTLAEVRERTGLLVPGS